jgi:hypothetical protein
VQPLWLPHAREIPRSLVGSVSGEDVHPQEVSLEELLIDVYTILWLNHEDLNRSTEKDRLCPCHSP